MRKKGTVCDVAADTSLAVDWTFQGSFGIGCRFIVERLRDLKLNVPS
jgi:hypothetical protein